MGVMIRYLIILVASGFLLTSCTQKENSQNKFVEPVSVLYDTSLAPFYHGVASGDPLSDGVIIWTRVTPETILDRIPVKWEVSETPEFSQVKISDTTSALATKDYTVKIEVPDLEPGKTYYYRFQAMEKTSITGRTKTTPLNSVDSLKFAVVSCSNWEFGFFNAYDKIADRDDVAAVIHLGDYIYEYGHGSYGDTTIGRLHLPEYEIISLSDYRTRHSQYRLDKGLRRMSQQHPLIAIWDDHEVANDSYTKGAQNHQANEGDYETRKAAAKQAYYEWIPIREGDKHYRSFSFGNLADLIMLDERLEGRTKPVDSITDPKYFNDDRSILGSKQLNWLETKLQNSKTKWKVIGNQVMFSDIIQPPNFRKSPRNLDSWDGFPAEKMRLINFIQSTSLNNLIFVTGDTHAAWAIEAATEVDKTYDSKTSRGAFAIEFGVTSVSSGNDNERMPDGKVREIEESILQLNPHIKYINDRDHGYLLLTLYPYKAKGEFYFMESLRKQGTKEFREKKFIATSGKIRLIEE
jgi:alkaline phosphatase D